MLFVWALVGVGLMIGAWTLATPIGAAPDESGHTTQAVAIVRGQFDVPPQSFNGQPSELVRVPCWVDNPWVRVDPGCTSGRATTGLAPTQFSNYPPLYYVIVGLPSLFVSGTGAIYAMNAVGDLLNTTLVALGIWLVLRYHPRRLVLLGVLIALSPMVLFLMAVLNTSGLEIAAGIATWCALLCVVTYRRVPRALGLWTSVALILLVLSRPASPLDLLIIAIVLAAYVGRRQWRNSLRGSVRALWIPVAVVLAIAAVFLVVDGQPHLVGAPPAHKMGVLSNMATTLRLTGGYVEQSVGDFGSRLNIAAPTWVSVAWAACLGALTVAALVLSRPCRRALPMLALSVVLLTIALEAPEINVAGTYFQGRYLLPLLVGFPLVAASFEWRGRPVLWRPGAKAWAGVIVVVLLGAQAVAFHGTLHAYGAAVHGLDGATAHWSPPGGVIFVESLFVLGALVTSALVMLMVSGAGDLMWSSNSRPARAVRTTAPRAGPAVLHQ